MPTREVFCFTGQDVSGGKPINYSIDSSGVFFENANVLTSFSLPPKEFFDIRYNPTISQWVSTGNLGGTGTSRIFYSNDAYNWSQSAYVNGTPFSTGGTIITGDYGIIDASGAVYGWLFYGIDGSDIPVPIGVSTSDVTSQAAFTEYNNTFSNIDLSGSKQMKLRGDASNNWILSFNKTEPPVQPDTNIYYIDTSGINTSANPNNYTYIDISGTINPIITAGTIPVYAQGLYSSNTSIGANKWAVCGPQVSLIIGPNEYQTVGGFVSMTTSAVPDTNASWTTVVDSSNIVLTSIATDNSGTWVAVGAPAVTGTNPCNLITSITDGSGSWSEIMVDASNVSLIDIATNGAGNWVAIGNKQVDASSIPVAYYSSDLSTWLPSDLSNNTLNTFRAITAGIEDVPCFLKGTLIRTPSGEVPIETLKEGDEVITTTGEIKAITNIQRATVLPTEDTCPYKIPAGDLGATQDLYISPTHGVRTAGGETVEAQFLGYPQEKMTTSVEYYNISIGRLRSELIYANGVAVESMGEDGKNVAADVSTHTQERIFTEEVRTELINKLNNKMKISYDKLVSYPDSYLQELLSR